MFRSNKKAEPLDGSSAFYCQLIKQSTEISILQRIYTHTIRRIFVPDEVVDLGSVQCLES